MFPLHGRGTVFLESTFEFILVGVTGFAFALIVDVEFCLVVYDIGTKEDVLLVILRKPLNVAGEKEFLFLVDFVEFEVQSRVLFFFSQIFNFFAALKVQKVDFKGHVSLLDKVVAAELISGFKV